MSVELIILFFLIAFVYSSVGFGGGSSYLALLALFGIDFLSLRAIALLCNITVVSGSVIIYWRRGLILWNKIWPLIIISVPAAFIGGYLRISEPTFFTLLGFTLIVAAIAMFIKSDENLTEPTSVTSGVKAGTIGGSIGFLSGIVGIGGGIFLSPLLHLMKWDRSIVIASTASVYILFNSIAGLMGQAHNLDISSMDISLIVSLMIAVFVGGQLGVRVGIFKFRVSSLRKITAILIFIVGIRVLIKYLL